MGIAGERPMTRAAHAVVIGMCLLGTVSARATTIEGTATIRGRPAVDAVVYVDGARPSPTPAPPPHVVMDQKNLAFVPRVLPVARGTVVEFTNSDDVQHNVFSPSATAGKFNLGTYGPGATRTLTLDQPGDVRVLCNIHMEMESHILVLDGPYFSVVAADGSFRIPDVPAGTYTLKIWRTRWLPFTQAVELPASGSVGVNVVVGE
jgi:plastocyanin